jgi:hypothetical protein
LNNQLRSRDFSKNIWHESSRFGTGNSSACAAVATMTAASAGGDYSCLLFWLALFQSL